MRIELQGTTLASTVRQVEKVLGPVAVQLSPGGSALLHPEGGGEAVPVFRVYSDLYLAVIHVEEGDE